MIIKVDKEPSCVRSSKTREIDPEPVPKISQDVLHARGPPDGSRTDLDSRFKIQGVLMWFGGSGEQFRLPRQGEAFRPNLERGYKLSC